jgi:hypothetical protein
MIVRLGVAALLVMASSGPALAGSGTCIGVAKDEARGHSLLVRLRVNEAGAIENREAEWQLAAPGKQGAEGLSLKLGFVAQVPEGLGPVTSVTLNYFSMRNPNALKRATGTLEDASGARWSAPFQGMMGLGFSQLSVKTPWGGRVNPELTESIVAANKITVAIKGQGGTILESLILEPSDSTSRDRLFLEAKAKAEQLAAAPKPCG